MVEVVCICLEGFLCGFLCGLVLGSSSHGLIGCCLGGGVLRPCSTILCGALWGFHWLRYSCLMAGAPNMSLMMMILVLFMV